MDFIYTSPTVSGELSSLYLKAKYADRNEAKELFLKRNKNHNVKWGLVYNENVPVEVLEYYSNTSKDALLKKLAEKFLKIRTSDIKTYSKYRDMNPENLFDSWELLFNDNIEEDYLYLNGQRERFFTDEMLQESFLYQKQRDLYTFYAWFGVFIIFIVIFVTLGTLGST